MTEPSLYEKTQTEAIAEAVRWCGFEPTPDLVAKLERKRRFFGATGFQVAAAITRAFKLVEGTSNAPQSASWINAVVERALKVSQAVNGAHLSAHGATARPVQPSGGQPYVSTTETPATHGAPVGDLVANDQQAEAAGPQLVKPPEQPCSVLSAEDRRLLAQIRKEFPFASRQNLLDALPEYRAKLAVIDGHEGSNGGRIRSAVSLAASIDGVSSNRCDSRGGRTSSCCHPSPAKLSQPPDRVTRPIAAAEVALDPRPPQRSGGNGFRRAGDLAGELRGRLGAAHAGL